MILMTQASQTRVDSGPVRVHRAASVSAPLAAIAVIALVTPVLSGCPMDVGTFYSQNVEVRVVSRTTGEPVQGARVGLNWPSDRNDGSQVPRRTSESDEEGLAVIELQLVECFQSIFSVLSCEVSEEGIVGRVLIIDVSIETGTLLGEITVAAGSELTDGDIVVTIVGVSPKLFTNRW